MKKIILAFLSALLFLSACSSDNDDVTGNSGEQDIDVATIDSNYTYELPVVFHVLYQDESNQTQYIPYQRFANIINYVNRIYQGNIYGESENVNIKFVLATKDEDGKTLQHPGVDYVRYTGDYPIDPEEFMNDNSGDNVKYIWDPNSYINVMMYNFKQTSSDGITLGISHMPLSAPGHDIAGLEKSNYSKLTKKNLAYAYCSSINSLYAWTGNSANNGGYYESTKYQKMQNSGDYLTTGSYTIEPSDIIVTIAHELGHYLGLFHAFTERVNDSSSEPVDSCADTDFCTDTPSYNYFEYQEYLQYLALATTLGGRTLTADDVLRRVPCDSTAEEFESEDIMDYSYTLGFKITKEQKERMRNVLYYSPLIPGPKKDQASNTTRAAEGVVDLKLRTIK